MVTGAAGPGPRTRDPRARPHRAAARARPRRALGRGASARRRTSRPRRAASSASRKDAAMTGRCPERPGPAPTGLSPPSAARGRWPLRMASLATTSFSASGSTSTFPASSTATSVPRTSRPRSTWSSFVRRLASGRGLRIPRPVGGEVADLARRAWLTPNSRPSKRRPRRLRASPAVPRAHRSLLRFRASRRPDETSRPPPLGSTRCFRAMSRSRTVRPLGRPIRRRPDRSRASRTGSWPVSGHAQTNSVCPKARASGLARERQPWAGYNWYDGGRRSRVDINTDLPARAWDLVHTVAHETYPGHHLEHAWKEADPRRRSRPPRGLGPPAQYAGVPHLGRACQRRAPFAAPPEERTDLLIEVSERAGPESRRTHRGSRRRGADTGLADARQARSRPRERRDLRHADGRSHDRSSEYLCEVGRMTPERRRQAARIHRTPALADLCLRLRRRRGADRPWLDAVPEPERPPRFGRLLHEALTPADLTADG